RCRNVERVFACRDTAEGSAAVALRKHVHHFGRQCRDNKENRCPQGPTGKILIIKKESERSHDKRERHMQFMFVARFRPVMQLIFPDVEIEEIDGPDDHEKIQKNESKNYEMFHFN